MSATAVYDVSDRSTWFDHGPEFSRAYAAWVDGHGVDTKPTYRVEHHLIDAPLIRVFQYATDADGRLCIDRGDVVRRPPFDVLIRSEPPRPEDYR